MRSLLFILFSLEGVALANGDFLSETPDGNGTCPLWRVRNGTSCVCGSDLSSIIKCDDLGQYLALKTCYCMTYSEQLMKPLVSYCLYSCNLDIHDEFMDVRTTNITELNDVVCGLYSRTGLMCGRCVDGFAPAVYSYSLACANCSNYKYNIIKYIAIAYIPLTVFYVVVIAFRIPVNSGAMIAYVALSQVVAAPGLITFYSARFERYNIRYINGFIVLYTIWNLDFFRSLYEPFCLHPDLTTVDVISLDYILGVYPLVLTVVTYLLVQLHDHSRLLTRICRPLYRCFYRFKKVWNIRESLVKAFATFLVLSYVKIMNVSVELLTPAHGYYDMSGRAVNTTFLYSNGSMEYFGRDHIPYAVLAIVMTALFNVFPLVLMCAYPCQCCQKLLNLIPFKHHVLHTFMDTLQGEFREQPQDCRYFAGFYIALRIVNLIIYAFFKSPLYYLWMTCVVVFFTFLLAVVRPYKHSVYNKLDPWLFSLLVVAYIAVSVRFEGTYIAPKEAPHYRTLISTISIVVLLLPPLYGVLLLVYRILPTWNWKQLYKWTRGLVNHHQELENSLLYQRRDYANLS